MRKPGRTVCAAIAAAVLALAGVLAGPVTDATGKPKVAVRTVTKVRGGYITKFTYADGTVVQAYSDVPMHEATPSSRTADQAAAGTATTEHSLSGLLVPDTRGPTGAAKLTQQPAAALSPYSELTALGVSPKDAAPFLNMQAPTPSGVTSARFSATASAGLPQLWSTKCVNISFDGSKGHLYGCDRQYKIWVNPNNGSDWYLQNQHLATATMHDSGLFNPDELTGLKFGIAYSANNQIMNWSPIDTRDMGSCTTTSASVSAKGATISSSATECPETWGVFYIGPLHFTTKWDGRNSGPSDGARATHGVASVHNPPNAATDRDVPWTVWWA